MPISPFTLQKNNLHFAGLLKTFMAKNQDWLFKCGEQKKFGYAS